MAKLSIVREILVDILRAAQSPQKRADLVDAIQRRRPDLLRHSIGARISELPKNEPGIFFSEKIEGKGVFLGLCEKRKRPGFTGREAVATDSSRHAVGVAPAASDESSARQKGRRMTKRPIRKGTNRDKIRRGMEQILSVSKYPMRAIDLVRKMLSEVDECKGILPHTIGAEFGKAVRDEGKRFFRESRKGDGAFYGLCGTHLLEMKEGAGKPALGPLSPDQWRQQKLPGIKTTKRRIKAPRVPPGPDVPLATRATMATTPGTPPERAERDFYDSFANWLKDGEMGLGECVESYVSGSINFQQGKWLNPDVIGFNKPEEDDYVKYPPEVVAAEIKASSSPGDVMHGFGQACAFRLFAHKVYLVVPELDPRSPMEKLCHLHGIGLVFFDPAASELDLSIYALRIMAQYHTPDVGSMRDMMNFIRGRRPRARR